MTIDDGMDCYIRCVSDPNKGLYVMAFDDTEMVIATRAIEIMLKNTDCKAISVDALNRMKLLHERFIKADVNNKSFHRIA